MLRSIEKATSQAITRMDVPTANVINQIRVDQFKQNILDLLESSNITFFQEIIEDLMEESSADPVKIAAALAHLNNGNRPFLLDPKSDRKINKPESERESRDRDSGRGSMDKLSAAPRPLKDHPDVKLVRYRLDVGYKDNVKPGNIVGAIANTADLDSEYIGQIEIYNNFSTVDLPDGMPKSVLSLLKPARVANKPMNLRMFSMDDVNEKSLAASPKKRSTKPRSNRRNGSKPDRKGKANRTREK
jgi:ATP-dependent RNA helicase DeaD